jgi:molybdopterin molybdotransferase
LSDEGACFEIMTGAVCSFGCDTVVPYEHIRMEGDTAHIDILPVAKGKNIHKQGSDKKAGDLLVAAGTIVSPAEIGIAASIGKSVLSVQRLPRILICSTGDELIDISETPLPHQIRRSNVHALQALIKSVGIEADSIHLVDEKNIMLEALEEALNNYDLLILSGGVSKGKFDLIPEVLNALGVETIFHTIAQRPGKPMWFGTSQKTVVFALPGNPVSTLACAARYVLPWLKAQMGIESMDIRIPLQEAITPNEKLTLFLPVRVTANLSLQAQLIRNQGSGDFSGLAGMTGFIEVEPGTESPSHFRYFPLG